MCGGKDILPKAGVGEVWAGGVRLTVEGLQVG